MPSGSGTRRKEVSKNSKAIELTLEQLMKEPRPDPRHLTRLIDQADFLARERLGHGFIEPSRAVGKLQYIAGKLDVDALELARIRGMIKDYGKRIGVYESKAHREMKKHVKRNTRKAKASAERKRRNNAKNVYRAPKVYAPPPREESPPFEFERASNNEESAAEAVAGK